MEEHYTCSVCGRDFPAKGNCLEHEKNHQAEDLIGKIYHAEDAMRPWMMKDEQIRTRFYIPIGYVAFDPENRPQDVAMKCVEIDGSNMEIDARLTTVDLACFIENDINERCPNCVHPEVTNVDTLQKFVMGWVSDIVENAVKEGHKESYEQWKQLYKEEHGREP